MTHKKTQIFITCMPGPTHHFGGHSIGNLASMQSKGAVSNPKAAAIEWLQHLKLIDALGGIQYIIPPHRRPNIMPHNPTLLDVSSAFTWMANGAHFIPSKPACIIPANMHTTPHRSTEHRFNKYWLRRLFFGTDISVLNVLDSPDEGAANDIYLWNPDTAQGLSVFISGETSTNFPVRQSKTAYHQLIKQQCLSNYFLLTQHEHAIDAGVFHNDVISFGYGPYFFCHEQAFKDQSSRLTALADYFESKCGIPLQIIQVLADQLSLEEAIATYLFNSQIILVEDDVILVCPIQVKDHPKAFNIVSDWKDCGYINNIAFTDLTHSLMNGGGPACLRLSCMVAPNTIGSVSHEFKFSASLINELTDIVTSTYPSSCSLSDIQSDPNTYRQIVRNIEAVFL
jgi:succinylarginine dihydrolase